MSVMVCTYSGESACFSQQKGNFHCELKYIDHFARTSEYLPVHVPAAIPESCELRIFSKLAKRHLQELCMKLVSNSQSNIHTPTAQSITIIIHDCACTDVPLAGMI